MKPELLAKLFKPHPWHGISIGDQAPSVVRAYIEIVPTDVVKYEIDKPSGHLKIDRPQKYSNQCPALYGFIPQTYCGNKVGEFSAESSGRARLRGDGDPMDICVFSERPIQHGDILLSAVPIGGFRMIDRDEADDKIIAVLHQDSVYGHWKDISDCPKGLVERLRHYFLTYKDIPGEEKRNVEIADTYGAETARKAIELSRSDYQESFKDICDAWKAISE